MVEHLAVKELVETKKELKEGQILDLSVGFGTELSTFKGTDQITSVPIHLKSIGAKFQYLREHLSERVKYTLETETHTWQHAHAMPWWPEV